MVINPIEKTNREMRNINLKSIVLDYKLRTGMIEDDINELFIFVVLTKGHFIE